jgi:putative spermidine/putrescine transport system permease protein
MSADYDYSRISLRQRLANRGFDGVTLLVLPALVFLVAVFVYPFFYGLTLSFMPKAGSALANYQKFFSDPYLYNTVMTTLWLALPVTLISIAMALPIAFVSA